MCLRVDSIVDFANFAFPLRYGVAFKSFRHEVFFLCHILSLIFFASKISGEKKPSAMASEIAKLAALVLTNTVRVDDYLQTNCLPSPSFHEDGPVDLKLSVEIEAARVVALEASLRLNDLLRGPIELLRPTVYLHAFIADRYLVLTRSIPSLGQCGQSRSNL